MTHVNQRAGLRAGAAFLRAALVALALAPGTVAAQTLRDVRVPREPLVLRQQGSFFVGGRQKFSEAAGWDVAGALPQYGTGDVTVDQMYVQFQVPLDAQKHVPVVFVHGCCLSSKTWETTPDGRMGWYEYFTRQGRATYLADQVGRARSGFDATVFNQAKQGLLPLAAQPPILIASAQFAWGVFRFGPEYGTAWPDQQFPIGKVNEMYKQVIPDLSLTIYPNLFAELGNPASDRNPTVDHMATLARDLGGAILVGHSQSSGFPLKAALEDPTGVRGIIGLETGCFANLTPAQIAVLARIPILVVEGDHYATASPPAACVTQMRQVNAAGGDMVYIHLPDIGMRGNSHMFMQDRNNIEVADVILDWIDNHVERKSRRKNR